MNLLVALLVAFAAAVGLLVVLPVLVGLGLALALPMLWLVIWLLPIVIILSSDRTTGGEKLAWILAIVCLSWFAWVFYFLLAPIARPDHAADHARYPRYYDYRSGRY